MAAGLSLEEGRLEAFSEVFPDEVHRLLEGIEPVNEIRTDGGLEPPDLEIGLALALEQGGPWGQRFPEPLFDGNFEVLEQRIVGEKHLKLAVRHAEGREVVEAIAFNHLPEDLERAGGASGAGTVRMLYRVDVNRWQGSERCQLIVEHFVAADQSIA